MITGGGQGKACHANRADLVTVFRALRKFFSPFARYPSLGKELSPRRASRIFCYRDAVARCGRETSRENGAGVCHLKQRNTDCFHLNLRVGRKKGSSNGTAAHDEDRDEKLG